MGELKDAQKSITDVSRNGGDGKREVKEGWCME